MTTDAGTPRTDALRKRVHSRYGDQRTPHFPRESYCVDYDEAVRSLTAAETDRDALRARVAGLEASGKLLQQAHSAVLRSLQKQAPCFADTDRLDAMEKQSWTVGHYASGRYFVHLGLINGKQCETTGSALRIAIDEARALLAPSSSEVKP